jgi:hypothetical protein
MNTNLETGLLHRRGDPIEQCRNQAWNRNPLSIFFRGIQVLQQCYYQTLVHSGNDIGRNIRYDLTRIYRLLKDICNVLLECASQFVKDSMLFFVVLLTMVSGRQTLLKPAKRIARASRPCITHSAMFIFLFPHSLIERSGLPSSDM